MTTSVRRAVLLAVLLSCLQGSYGQDDQDIPLNELMEASDDSFLGHSLRHSRRPLALAHHHKHSAPADVDAKDLEAKAKLVSNDLGATVDEASHYVREGAVLTHDIAQKGVKVRIDRKKLRKLEGEAGRLSETKESLLASLHGMLGAKIDVAQKRVEKRDAVLQKNKEAVEEWRIKMEELKVASKDLVKEKHSVKQALLEAEAEVARAKEKEEKLRRTLTKKNLEAAEKVQKFQYAETRYQAQVAHADAAEKAAVTARKSLDELHHTLETESQKVVQSVEYHKFQLDRKINAVEQDREKYSEELANLKGKFTEWKKDMKWEREEISKKRHEQELASEEAAEHKRQIKKATKTKPVHTAETDGDDWDSWGQAAADSD